MSVEQLESAIRAMPPAERAAFADWFDAHRHDLLGEASDISPAAQDELVLRLKEIDAHPEILEPFEEGDVERMFKNIADAHARKTFARHC